jgi:hypothetical protein
MKPSSTSGPRISISYTDGATNITGMQIIQKRGGTYQNFALHINFFFNYYILYK